MEQTTNNPYSNQFITTSPTSVATSNNAVRLLNGATIERVLDDLYTTEYQLKEPLPITLQYERKCYIAIQENLNIGAADKTLQGVERELAVQIVKLYKKLSNLEKSTLGPYPKQLLAYLNNYIA